MLKTERLTSLKINVTIMSIPHAYLQTIYKTPAKFQKDRNNRSKFCVARIKYPLIVSEMAKTDYVRKLKQSERK